MSKTIIEEVYHHVYNGGTKIALQQEGDPEFGPTFFLEISVGNMGVENISTVTVSPQLLEVLCFMLARNLNHTAKGNINSYEGPAQLTNGYGHKIDVKDDLKNFKEIIGNLGIMK